MMTERQILEYIRLVDQRLDYVMHVWEGNIEDPELLKMDTRLRELRRLVDQEHITRGMEENGKIISR